MLNKDPYQVHPVLGAYRRTDFTQSADVGILVFKEDMTMTNKRELKTVRSHIDDLTAEEFPEGAYGSDQPQEKAGKHASRRTRHDSPGPYSFENKELHAGITRDYPGSDPSSS